MTTSTLRPNATSFASYGIGGGLTGGASADACTSDNSDSSYVTMSDGAQTIVELGTVSLPAGAVTVSARVRARGSTASSTDTAHANLQVAGTLIGVPNVFGFSSSPANFAGSPVAVNWSQTEIDAMQIAFGKDGGADARFLELYVDLVYATQPTVTATAPSGAVTTVSQPTVTWTYAPGSDGGAQTRYQIRVFSAAEYGVAGFNPSTSPATYDSGQVLGAATSAKTGVLPNSTTYKAYVRAAQSINGAAHWSDWSNISFSISITPPAVSTVVVSGDNALARNRIVVTRSGGSPAWTTLDVERTDDGGVTWVPVRGATDVAPPGDVWIGYDYESGNGITSFYQARGRTPLIVGEWTTSFGVSWSSSDDWLKDVRTTTRSRVVQVLANPALQRDRPQGVFSVVGRRDPVVISDIVRTSAGTITFITDTDQEAVDLLALLDNDVLLLQSRLGARLGSKYIAIGGITETPVVATATEPTRYFTVPFREVVAPVDSGIVIGGLTWQDVVDTYATWTAVNAGIATWGDLV